ncbi:uncharacterized protein LOC117780597 [Drosophila innubila]|uniref:uncharacterized protein LOC117780597 n=1 Tax=Drosophila innubila TaxID=198719 RepID=UPI00148E8366|nr:uncharacterized protein LOC117780597 [Drosophila innubila]
MWKKLICGLVLVAFVGLQFAQSLTCYSCNSPQSCQNPSTQVCNNATANATSSLLSTIHSDVLITGSNSFKCMNLTYFIYANSIKMAEILGCFHQGIPVCSLTLNATNSQSWARSCKTCDYDRCNRNPAGTLSRSTYVMVASVMALILGKLWN